MKILESLRGDPWNYVADKEYFKKGYRALVGVPGRVLQARELSALSMYPIYSLNELASEIFNEGVIDGFDMSDDAKIETGSVFGMKTYDLNLSDYKVYDIDEATGNQTEVIVDLDQLNPPVNPGNLGTPGTPGTPNPIAPSPITGTSIIVIPHTGEDTWPQDIIP